MATVATIAGTKSGMSAGGVTFLGVKELDLFLQTMPGELRREIEKKVIGKSGRILAAEMQRLCPVGSSSSGHSRSQSARLQANAVGRKGGLEKDGSRVKLRNAITTRPSSQWRTKVSVAARGIIAVAVGPKWPEGAHAHLLEFGHRLVAWGRDTSIRVAPKPFMRPAVANTRGAIASQQESDLRKALKKATGTTLTKTQSNKAAKAFGGGNALNARDAKKAARIFSA